MSPRVWAEAVDARTSISAAKKQAALFTYFELCTLNCDARTRPLAHGRDTSFARAAQTRRERIRARAPGASSRRIRRGDSSGPSARARERGANTGQSSEWR